MQEQEDKDNQYLVLARKYRPQNFDDLIGQDALVQTFTNAIKNNRLHHAYVLNGIRGIGKTTTARIMAKALNCTGLDGKGGPTAHPCGVCENCRAIAEDRHIDVMELDAASRTGVDDMREILDGVRYKPTVGRYKVYIIDEVHMLSKSAFNALLKTLEEPPSHVKFIFATTEIRKIPVTVLSRCQRFDLQRLSTDNLMGLFHKIEGKECFSADEEALEIIAKAADGSARDGLSLLDQAISIGAGNVKTYIVKNMIGLADRTQTFSLFENLLEGSLDKVVANLQNQYKNGANPQLILNDLIEITHLLLKIKIVPDGINFFAMSENEKDLCKNLAGRVSVAVLSKIWQMLIKGVSEMQLAPVQIDALEMILLRIAYSANLPTPYEILNDIKKKPDLVLPQRSAATRPAPAVNPAPTIPVSETPKQKDEVPVPIKEVQIPAAPMQNAPFTLGNLLDYLENHKKMMLLYTIKNDISFSEFCAGSIKLKISPRVTRDNLAELRKILLEATGYEWTLDVSVGMPENTIADRENAEFEQKKQNISKIPLVKAVMSEFRGAKIETFTRKVEKTETDTGSDDESEMVFEEDI